MDGGGHKLLCVREDSKTVAMFGEQLASQTARGGLRKIFRKKNLFVGESSRFRQIISCIIKYMHTNHLKKEKEEVIEEIISWEAPEYEYNPKSVSWYWLSLIISIILIALSLWQRNFLFAVFIFIAELVLLYFSNRFPKLWEFKIDDTGIAIGDSKFYYFSDIHSFDIHPIDEEYRELILRMKSKFSSYTKIFIFRDDEKKIEQRLLKFVEKQEITPPLVDSLEKFFNF